MSLQTRYKRFAKTGGIAYAVTMGAVADLVAAGVLALLKLWIPSLDERLPVPLWLLMWGIAAATIVVVFLVNALLQKTQRAAREAATLSDRREEGSEAYIFLTVQTGHSESVARWISEQMEVRFAVAVWGQWDIIARVEAGTSRALIRFLAAVQNNSRVHRTETHVVRNDQTQIHATQREEHIAFLLLKLHGGASEDVLDQLSALKEESGAAKIQHAAGLLGQFDIVMMVRYSRDIELSNLVMQYAQNTLSAETTTIPAIRQMAYCEGRPI